MSCHVTVVVVGGDPAAGSATSASHALDRIGELERRWSRFRVDSEVSRINAAAGAPRVVSPDTVELVVALVEAWHVTDGAFDPTLLAPLVGLGYAASRDDAEARTSLVGPVAPRGRPDAILVDRDHRVVRLPVGTVVDPGGLGKGLAADIVVDELIAAGAAGALVELGGDIRVAGAAPAGGAWPIAVGGATGADVVELVSGGIATSSSRLRTWCRSGRTMHHLLDPGTLHPTDGDVVEASVIAGTARWAETFTKPPFVVGAARGLALLERHGLAGVVTFGDGTSVATASWHGHRRAGPDREHVGSATR